MVRGRQKAAIRRIHWCFKLLRFTQDFQIKLVQFLHVNISSTSFKLDKINEVNVLNQEKGWAKRIGAECTDCGQCAESCRILTELNESPGQIARRGIEMDEAYGCALLREMRGHVSPGFESLANV